MKADSWISNLDDLEVYGATNRNGEHRNRNRAGKQV